MKKATTLFAVVAFVFWSINWLITDCAEQQISWWFESAELLR
jgi:hypothetical protein